MGEREGGTEGRREGGGGRERERISLLSLLPGTVVTHLTHLSNHLIKHTSRVISSLSYKVHLPGPRGAAQVCCRLLEDLSGSLGEHWFGHSLTVGGGGGGGEWEVEREGGSEEREVERVGRGGSGEGGRRGRWRG